MVGSFLLTGAFHEDGFADFCDGFGGGWTKDKIIEIMKDSRVGTYGVVGLVSILALKFLSLKGLQPWQLVQALILAHTLSRYAAITFVFTHTYAEASPTSKTTPSKAKPVAQDVPLEAWAVATVLAAIPWLWMCFSLSWMVLFVPIPLVLLKIYLSNYFTKWIGGYTGDCLGATQQMAEVLIYLSLLIFLSHPFSFFHPKI
jgi:adenosylcobinamide-GDP ribazoletransferase